MPDGDQRPGIRVGVTDERGRTLRAPGLAAWLARVAPARARGVVSIALVPDGAMRRLNRDYAGKDAVTDVLTFPADATPLSGGTGVSPVHRDRQLGDVVIATGRARRQARDAGHTYQAELRVLALHGLLHLLGYDHHGNGGLMARVESRLRRKGGLAAGLIERARWS